MGLLAVWLENGYWKIVGHKHAITLIALFVISQAFLSCLSDDIVYNALCMMVVNVNL